MRKLLLTLTVLGISIFLNGIVYAQEFTNESFQGNYAFSGFAGPKVVYLGVLVADGDGNLTGSAIQHLMWGQRVEFTLEGTYTVNPDGSGAVNGSISNEGSAEQWDLVIMQAEVVDGVKLATEIYMVARNVIRGNPVRFNCKRLPDNQEFTNESFQGNYAFYESAGPIDATYGLAFVDGKENYAGPAVLRFNKLRMEALLEATYVINTDGTGLMIGTVTLSNGTIISEEVDTLDVVITQAEVVDGVNLATELFMVDESSMGILPPAAITMKRLPD